jgi:hypothetical protein
MKSMALWIIAGIALASMWAPATEIDVTEIAFEPGRPDPNIHQTTIRYGSPLPWLVWKRSINEAAGYDEPGFESFDLIFFLLHDAMIAVPILMLFRSKGKKLDSDSGELGAVES